MAILSYTVYVQYNLPGEFINRNNSLLFHQNPRNKLRFAVGIITLWASLSLSLWIHGYLIAWVFIKGDTPF